MTLTVHCVTKEPGLAVLTVVPLSNKMFIEIVNFLSVYLSVINTFQTFSRVWVTVALSRLNPVL